MPPPTNWTSFAESPYPWERDALDFVRNNLPTHEPFRAWSLFEFIALDGSVDAFDQSLVERHLHGFHRQTSLWTVGAGIIHILGRLQRSAAVS